MKLSNAGMNLLADLEGIRHKMYKDTVGKPTIGIGHLIILPEEKELLTKRLTLDEIYEMKRKDLVRFENNLNNIIEQFDLTLTQPQYDSLISFMFNVGVKAFNDSTLYKKLIRGFFDEVVTQFPRWTKKKLPNGKVVEAPEMYARRIAEQNIFLTEQFFTDIIIDRRMNAEQINTMTDYVTRYRKNLNAEGYFNA